MRLGRPRRPVRAGVGHAPTVALRLVRPGRSGRDGEGPGLAGGYARRCPAAVASRRSVSTITALDRRARRGWTERLGTSLAVPVPTGGRGAPDRASRRAPARRATRAGQGSCPAVPGALTSAILGHRRAGRTPAAEMKRAVGGDRQRPGATDPAASAKARARRGGRRSCSGPGAGAVRPRAQPAKAAMPVCARPRIRAWMSCVPS